MSAYIVDEKTINRIVSFINCKQYNGLKFLVDHYGIKLDTNKDLDSFANALMALNVAAVDCRYEEKNAIPIIRFRPVDVSRIQALKSLHCFRYQCMEGDIDERPLFKFIHDVILNVEGEIIHELPEYDKAEWA